VTLPKLAVSLSLKMFRSNQWLERAEFREMRIKAAARDADLPRTELLAGFVELSETGPKGFKE
jgi:hypothetical protein